MNERVAILVDGDNISAMLASKIVEIAAHLGQPDAMRVYTNASRLTGWHQAHGYRLIHAGDGKNASDLLLAIDAMELALSAGFTSFVIASSDGDFIHLAQRLREMGRKVIGIGEKKAPLSFRHACNEFTEICSPPKPPHAATLNAKAVTQIDRNIRHLIAAHSNKGEGMAIADLAQKMHAEFGTRISTYPERNWRAYLSARDTLYELDPRGAKAKVRFKQSGFQ